MTFKRWVNIYIITKLKGENGNLKSFTNGKVKVYKAKSAELIAQPILLRSTIHPFRQVSYPSSYVPALLNVLRRM